MNFPASPFPSGRALPARVVLHPTLHHTVMVGYQGWHHTPTDGAELGWTHYATYDAMNPDSFGPRNINIDYWPDVSEFQQTYPAPNFKLPDGTIPCVISASDESTIGTHFQWMKTYGIDGAFVQRFAVSIVSSAGEKTRAAANRVLQNELKAAQDAGRSIAVMYDLSGLAGGAMDEVIADWQQLVAGGLFESEAYQHHTVNGETLPVVGVWGVGFNDGRAYTLAETKKFFDALAGCCILAGVPRSWLRGQTSNMFPSQQDATNDKSLLSVLQSVHIISPWSVNRYNDLGQARLQLADFWLPDLAWCQAKGLEYMPVVFPGYHSQNMYLSNNQTGPGSVDRVAGRFLWEQYRVLMNQGGFSMFYQAMFDEVDEGTQIFKVATPAPATAPVLDYRVPDPNGGYVPVPGDFYLRLMQVITTAIHQNPMAKLPDRIPTFPDLPAVNDYLTQTNPAVYQAADNSEATNRALAKLAAAIVAWAPAPAPVGSDGARVTMGGAWAPRPTWSNQPGSAVTWELPVRAAGRYRLLLRYPGDPQKQNTTSGLITVQQQGAVVAMTTVNFQENTMQWNEVAVASLASDSPCLVSATQSIPAAARLPLMEARLEPAP